MPAGVSQLFLDCGILHQAEESLSHLFVEPELQRFLHHGSELNLLLYRGDPLSVRTPKRNIDPVLHRLAHAEPLLLHNFDRLLPAQERLGLRRELHVLHCLCELALLLLLGVGIVKPGAQGRGADRHCPAQGGPSQLVCHFLPVILEFNPAVKRLG